MKRALVAAVVVTAIVVATALALIRSRRDDEAAGGGRGNGQTTGQGRPRPSGRPTGSPSSPISMGEAMILIRDCKVRQTVSLHSGFFSLELKTGDSVEVQDPAEKRIWAEVQKVQKRCGPISIAME
jgi:hypothetical protein